jgi:hypothetical protein
MKRLFTLLAIVSFTIGAFAQAPQRISYQAVIRNTSNALVLSTPIGMRISILQGSSTGTPLYVETHTPTTNANGLVTIEIGGGTLVSGSLAAVDLKAGPYFVKSEIAVTAPLTTYTITGTSQLLSVPYALFAESVGNYTETDPVFGAWDKATGITIPSSQVSDFSTSVTNNAAVLANTAKVTNATHTGDATGATALTVVRINGVALAGLDDGLLKNNKGTGAPSIAVAGSDYLTPTGSAALLTNFPVLNQNTTGSAASFTGSLVGEVTGTQGATVVGNTAVLGKVLTGYASGPGTIVAGDNILQAIQKLNGNDATNANLTGEVTSVGNAATVSNAAVIGKFITGFTSTPGTLVPGDNILQAIQKLDGNDATNAPLTGEVTSVGNAATISNAAVIGKVLTGYTSGAGTIVPGDNILQAIQKLNGNDATNANLTGMVTSTGNATTVVTNANLTGDVTSTGNATTIANKYPMTATLPLSVTGTPSVIATGAVAITIAPATTTTAGSMSGADKLKLDGLTGGTSHYLGEVMDGGIIFNIYKESDGSEHGLIVAETESPTQLAWQTVGTLTTANSTWNGASNTALMKPNGSPAADYATTLTNWYLPSLDELNILFNNRFYVNKALSGIGGSTLISLSAYWSSVEYSTTNAMFLDFSDGRGYVYDKTTTASVRAIKSF